jgi:hypothetical protein
MPDFAHEQREETSEEHLSEAVGKCHDTDLDGVIGEYVERSLR